MKKNSSKGATKSANKELIRSLVFAIILATIFRSLAYEPFHIPSGSMKPTLLEGDYIFVSKPSFGYSRYSFPFGLPLFSGRILDDVPEAGDVIVFKLPSQPSINYIKRLVGMPGDTIQVRSSRLFINGELIPQERVEDFIEEMSDGSLKRIPRYIETLPNGNHYYVLNEMENSPLDNTPIYRVPEGHYFFMGDNRDNSADSRVLNSVGFVHYDYLVGRATGVFFSMATPFWKVWEWFKGIRTERFFHSIVLEKPEE
jgi:signal peptidase I